MDDGPVVAALSLAWHMTNGVALTSFNDNWDKVTDLELYIHKTKELAMCPTMGGKWIVLAQKNEPYVAAEYNTYEEAMSEWSHA